MNYFFLLDLFMEHLDRWEYKSWLDQPRRHCCARRDLSTVVTNGPCHYPIGTDDVLDSSLTHVSRRLVWTFIRRRRWCASTNVFTSDCNNAGPLIDLLPPPIDHKPHWPSTPLVRWSSPSCISGHVLATNAVVVIRISFNEGILQLNRFS
jgi:hypothetical protein